MNVHYTVCCHWINETESGQETVNNLLMTCFLFAFNSQVSYISQDCEEIPEFLGRKYGHMAKRLDLSFNLLRYVVMFRFFKCTTGHPLQSWIFFFFPQNRSIHICELHSVIVSVILFYQCLSSLLWNTSNQVSL